MVNLRLRSFDRRAKTAFGIVLCASIFLLILGFKNTYSRSFLNSDILWTIAFLDDLFVHGGHLADWNLSNHTDFFPDKLISLGVWWAVRHSYDLFIICYASISYAFWIITARYLTGSYWIGLLSAFVALVLTLAPKTKALDTSQQAA